jgi:hypothetical protein
MKTSALKQYLEQYSDYQLRFILPDEDVIPAHAHISEAGRIDKVFIDCGGVVRKISNVTLQAWVADDVDHRISPGKLAGILDIAAPLFGGDDLEVEVEYEDCSISQFPVLSASVERETLSFRLGSKHTDCLARGVCIPQAADQCGSGGCC